MLDETRAFIKIWNYSESMKEVQKKTGLSLNHCIVKASQLRGRGHDLKYFGRQDTDTRALRFMVLYNACMSAEEASAKLKMPIASLYHKASVMRRRGYFIKFFQRTRAVKDKNEMSAQTDMRRTAEDII
jgi:hypothetical protein